MSGSYFDPDWAAKVTVPVKRVGERWEFFYGGDIPVKDGTLGELTVNADQITDDRFRQRVTQELTVRILEEGTPLLVALSDRSTNRAQIGQWPDPRPLKVPVGTTRFERVFLGPPRKKPLPDEPQPEGEPERGGLFLKLKGLERCELHGSTVVMPKEFSEPAISLNHAFTMLSQAYEKHRISNTGNVYTRVFYEDRDRRWYPLDDLRTGVQAVGERKLLGDLWAEVEQKLGWRPAPVLEKPRRRK
jgi:hypothetical protein